MNIFCPPGLPAGRHRRERGHGWIEKINVCASQVYPVNNSLFSISPSRDGKDVLLARVFLRPYGLELTVDHLQNQGIHEILIGITLLVFKPDGTEGGHHIRGLHGIAYVIGCPGLCPSKDIFDDIEGGVGLRTMIGGIITETLLILLCKLLGSGILNLGAPCLLYTSPSPRDCS